MLSYECIYIYIICIYICMARAPIPAAFRSAHVTTTTLVTVKLMHAYMDTPEAVDLNNVCASIGSVPVWAAIADMRAAVLLPQISVNATLDARPPAIFSMRWDVCWLHTPITSVSSPVAPVETEPPPRPGTLFLLRDLAGRAMLPGTDMLTSNNNSCGKERSGLCSGIPGEVILLCTRSLNRYSSSTAFRGPAQLLAKRSLPFRS